MKDSARLLLAGCCTALAVTLVVDLSAGLGLAAAGETPRIDGLFDEWREGSRSVVDETGDATAAFDLARVDARSHGTQLYLHFHIGRELNLQAGRGDEGTLRLLVDLPAARRLSIDFRGRFACWTDRPDERIPWTKIKFACLPTFAAKEYELRLDLSPLGARAGDQMRIQFAGSDSLQEPLSIVLGDASAPHQGSAPHDVMDMSPRAGDVRIANLNTLHDGLSHPQRSEQIRRLLTSVDADIFCFQEALDEDSFRASAPRVVPRKGESALNLHWQGDCGIATSLPLQPLAMQFETRFSRTATHDRQTGAAAAIRLSNGQYVVVCSVHLSCCGFRDDVRDQSRVREARTLATQIERLRAGEFGDHLRSAGVVVIGDYNLVGSRQPLATLEAVGLTEYILLGLDRAACTWRGDEEESFWPGRLDLLTYDAAVLDPKAGYVLNTEDLSEARLRELGLERNDSMASDHLLLVADFAVRKNKPMK
ncbi:MAG: endonuclease/exonuclease/phosphatase family protein [Pirellulaceae bacterium]